MFVLKERLLKFYTDNKQAIINLLLALLFALAGVAGYQVGQENPSPAAVATAAAENPALLEVRGGERPTATPLATSCPCPSPGPSETPLPPADTPTQTATLEATATPSPTPIMAEHDVFSWHPAGLAFHHHGAPYTETHPAILEWLMSDPNGALFTQIGSPWGSSSTENNFPFPFGKHEGFVNLSETDTQCDLGKLTPQPDQPCILAYYYQVHALGLAHEFYARVHSQKMVALVCDRETQMQCDLVAVGGHVDIGERHALYKNTLCDLADNPAYPPEYSLDQPPYLTINGSARQFWFWSSLTNPVIRPYLDPQPNLLLQTAWNNRPFSSPALNDCADIASAVEHTNIENRNNQFQVFFINLLIADLPRPFIGFTDRWGNVVEGCTGVSVDCVPIYVGPDVPAGNPLLNRIVDHGDPEDAPIQVFGSDATLLPPGATP